MSTKLITYDLNKPGQNHDAVLAKIKAYGTWARLSESSYAVYTLESPETIFNTFQPLLDRNDDFLVIPLSKPYAGQNDKEVIDWLDKFLEYRAQAA